LKKKIERKSQSKYRSLNPGVQYDEYDGEAKLTNFLKRMKEDLIQQKLQLQELKKDLTQHQTTNNENKKYEVIKKVEEEVERLQSVIDEEEQSKQLELERLNEAAAHSI
jgi:hypothetical protein